MTAQRPERAEDFIDKEVVIDPVACPDRLRGPLPSGTQVVYRASRRFPRRYTPKDLARITRYVACDHGHCQAMGAVLEGLGQKGQVVQIVEELLQLRSMIEDRHKEATMLPAEWTASLALMLKFIAQELIRVTRYLRKTRVLRWFIRRFVLFKLALELLEQAALLIWDVEDLLHWAEKAENFMKTCTCQEVNGDDSAE